MKITPIRWGVQITWRGVVVLAAFIAPGGATWPRIAALMLWNRGRIWYWVPGGVGRVIRLPA